MKRRHLFFLLSIMILAGQTVSPVAGQESESAPEDANQLLKSRGIRKYKNLYTVIAEDEAFRLYRQTVAAMDEAGQAIALAGDAAARNQSIVDFQQRIAFDAGLRDQMRVEMRDGTSPQEQATRRAAAGDIAIAKQQRAILGQAGARPSPKQAEMLATKAAEACKRAEDQADADRSGLRRRRELSHAQFRLASPPGDRQRAAEAFGSVQETGRRTGRDHQRTRS